MESSYRQIGRSTPELYTVRIFNINMGTARVFPCFANFTTP